MDGADPDLPADAISIVGVDGAVVDRIDLPEPRIIRLAATNSDDHLVVLSRDRDDTATSVSIAQLSSRELLAVGLPDGDWQILPMTGGPSRLIVAADSSDTMAVIDLADGRVVAMPGDVAPGGALVSSSPSGDHLAVQAATKLTVFDVDKGTSIELAGARFVRWTGMTGTFEAVGATQPGGDLLRVFRPDGMEGPTNVDFGAPRVSVETDAGLVTLHERIIGVVTTAGGEVLYEGDGPFTEFLAVQTSTGLAVVFDGSGSGGGVVAIHAGTREQARLDLPLGVSAIRLRTSGPIPPWLIETRSGDVARVTAELTAEVVGTLDDDRLPEPREFHPGADAILVLRRTDGSVLERRGTVFGPGGASDVWLGSEPTVQVSGSGTHAAVAGVVGDRITVMMIDLSAGTTVAEFDGHSPAWLERRSS